MRKFWQRGIVSAFCLSMMTVGLTGSTEAREVRRGGSVHLGPLPQELIQLQRAVKRVEAAQRKLARTPGAEYIVADSIKALEDVLYVLDSGPIIYPPPRPRGHWVQTKGQSCHKVCSSKGLYPALSPEGAECASGENRPASAQGKIHYSLGVWPNAAPHYHSTAKSVGPFCYAHGQKRDSDRTDRTVGCFCK